jgi:hypothetical protein
MTMPDYKDKSTLKNISSCSSPGELIALAKEACSITKPNSEMADDEIRTITHWIFERLPDTSWKDGKIVPGRAGIELMLFVTMSEFPEFYQEHGLGQYN